MLRSAKHSVHSNSERTDYAKTNAGYFFRTNDGTGGVTELYSRIDTGCRRSANCRGGALR